MLEDTITEIPMALFSLCGRTEKLPAVPAKRAQSWCRDKRSRWGLSQGSRLPRASMDTCSKCCPALNREDWGCPVAGVPSWGAASGAKDEEAYSR